MRKEKLYIYGLLAALIACVIITVFTFFMARRYKKQYEKGLSEIRAEKEKDIKLRDLRIRALQWDNMLKDFKIESANQKIDSLEQVKQKIVIRYKDRYKEIESFTSDEITKYWQNEFKETK